ncbi:MAG: hypothetical protein EXR47_06480 [Dehalococcoidia bacterium]|nr:hypothetical protein [Dehalococcoidia bacterium]
METAATQALESVAAGRPVIIRDDFRGLAYLAVASQKAGPEHVNLMARYARGIISIALEGERLNQLQLPVMGQPSPNASSEPFAVSVDVRRDGASGISARDRSATIQALIYPASKPDDFVRPGHLFPVLYSKGGVFTVPRAPEAIVDLARMAGLYPSGVLCAIMTDAGDMMSDPPDLNALGDAIGAKIVSISDVLRLRGEREKVVKRIAAARLPTQYGEFTITAYQCLRDTDEHIALVMGDPGSAQPMPAAFVNGCVVGHVFDSQACRCGIRLEERLSRIGELKRGVILYTPNDAVSKHLGEDLSTRPPMHERIWHQIIGVQVLSDLGIRRAYLLDEEREIDVPALSTL